MKESLVLLSGCLQMINVRKRHNMKMALRAKMFHMASPPCTARMLNARINSPAGQQVIRLFPVKLNCWTLTLTSCTFAYP